MSPEMKMETHVISQNSDETVTYDEEKKKKTKKTKKDKEKKHKKHKKEKHKKKSNRDIKVNEEDDDATSSEIENERNDPPTCNVPMKEEDESSSEVKNETNDHPTCNVPLKEEIQQQSTEKSKKGEKKQKKKLKKQLKKEAKKLKKAKKKEEKKERKRLKKEEKKKRKERDDSMTNDNDVVDNNNPTKRQRLNQNDNGSNEQTTATNSKNQSATTTASIITQKETNDNDIINDDDKLLECAMDAAHTGSINILTSTTNESSTSSSSSSATPFTIPTISTSCNLNRPEPHQIKQQKQQQQQQESQHLIRYLPIRIQPLLVLDINGFLCTRTARPKSSNNNNTITTQQATDYREPIGRAVANTKIIPRVTGTDAFLRFLDRHFTLAVWTSAKMENAKKLVNALFPVEVKSRLLFIWGQSKCESIPIRDSYKPLFIKSIHKVWMEYPLWNHTNSLLIDDTTDKCPAAYQKNTLHPPSLTGTISGQTDDKANEEKQRAFFEKFVDRCRGRCLEEVEGGDDGLATVLKECQAQSNMGWRYKG